MIALPNGNKCSELSVFPKNWKSKTADLSKTWYISYRFYYEGKAKRIEIKGMNRFSDYQSRKDATEALRNDELEALRNGYNPVNKRMELPEQEGDLNPYTPFNQALDLAASRLKIKKETKAGIKLVIGNVKEAADVLRFSSLPVSEIKRKHVKLLLEQVLTKAKNTANNFNHYRKYLGIVFSELVELEAIEHSPIDKELRKQKVTKKIREVLTEEERIQVDECLKKLPNFRRFVHIFYHSGARITELLNVKGKDLDLTNQRYKCIISKGREKREVWRIIKDVALPYWKELKPGKEDYLFSRGLKPGPVKIAPIQVTRRWRNHIKNKKTGLGISKDLYSLKHLATSETVDLLNSKEAAKLNAHTSEVMVEKVYDVRKKERADNKIKGLTNKFA